jgi:predicted nucleic acid-binding protein
LIVVSDASPLISLGAVGRIELLRQLFGEISIPPAVLQEVTEAGAGRPGAFEVQTAGWIASRTVESEFLPRALEGELDRGEAEAIALAVQLRAHLLLVDERRGRRVASRFGLKVVGVLGILVAAKRQGFLLKIEPVLGDLREKAGFRVSPALYQRALEEVGEV